MSTSQAGDAVAVERRNAVDYGQPPLAVDLVKGSREQISKGKKMTTSNHQEGAQSWDEGIDLLTTEFMCVPK